MRGIHFQSIKGMMKAHPDAKMIIAIYWPTRKTVRLKIPQDIKDLDQDELKYVFRASIP